MFNPATYKAPKETWVAFKAICSSLFLALSVVVILFWVVTDIIKGQTMKELTFDYQDYEERATFFDEVIPADCDLTEFSIDDGEES